MESIDTMPVWRRAHHDGISSVGERFEFDDFGTHLFGTFLSPLGCA
jgi:hypothetical protein